MPEGIAIHCPVVKWPLGLQNNRKAIFSLLKIYESTARVEQRTELNAFLLGGRGQELAGVSGSRLVYHSPVPLLPSGPLNTQQQQRSDCASAGAEHWTLRSSRPDTSSWLWCWLLFSEKSRATALASLPAGWGSCKGLPPLLGTGRQVLWL